MKKIVESVGIVILEDDKVVLVQNLEKSGHVTGVYGLPAGRVDEGETYEEAVIRETIEETGLEIKKNSLIRLPKEYVADLQRKSGDPVSFHWVVFLATEFSGNFVESEETNPGWYLLSELSSLTLLPNVEDAIKQARKFST